MAKEYCWDVSVDGTDHQVCFIRASKAKKCRLTVDGLPIPICEIEPGVIDQLVQVGSKECRLVVARKADFVVDGKLLSNGRPYAPLKKRPWWSWIFFVLNVLIPIVARGGAIPMLLGVGGVTLCFGQFQAFYEKKAGQQIL